MPSWAVNCTKFSSNEPTNGTDLELSTLEHALWFFGVFVAMQSFCLISSVLGNRVAVTVTLLKIIQEILQKSSTLSFHISDFGSIFMQPNFCPSFEERQWLHLSCCTRYSSNLSHKKPSTF